MTFQEVILTLDRYWADYGCVIQQPYDLEWEPAPQAPNATTRAKLGALAIFIFLT